MFQSEKILKSDAFGSIEKGQFIIAPGHPALPAIKRCYTSHWLWGNIGRWLARKEKKAIQRLQDRLPHDAAFPKLLQVAENYHVRSFIAGQSLHHCDRPIPASYFKDSKALLRQMRRQGISNNDLAKEANWLITADDKPAITDFQLAVCHQLHRSPYARLLAREDLRHLLKHKRTYAQLTSAESRLVNRKSWPSRIWQHTGKRVYWFVTRKILGWSERKGPEERDF